MKKIILLATLILFISHIPITANPGWWGERKSPEPSRPQLSYQEQKKMDYEKQLQKIIDFTQQYPYLIKDTRVHEYLAKAADFAYQGKYNDAIIQLNIVVNEMARVSREQHLK